MRTYPKKMKIQGDFHTFGPAFRDWYQKIEKEATTTMEHSTTPRFDMYLKDVTIV